MPSGRLGPIPDKRTEVYMQEIVMSGGVAKVRTRGNQTPYWIDSTYLE